MGEILHLIDHHIVYLRSLIPPEPEDIEHIVDRIHDLIPSVSDLPPLVLAKGLIDVQFLLTGEEGVGRDGHIGVLGKVLSGVLMCIG